MIFLTKKFVLSMIIRIFAASVPAKPLNDAQMRGAFLYIYVLLSKYANGTFQETKNTIDREYAKSTEVFIRHFKNSYCDPYPPSWILGELLTMGNVNMVYRNLKADKIRKRISHYFGLQPIVLESWITSLTLLRNASCHHSRVWNKVNSIMPVSPRRIAHPWTILPTNPQRVYFTICIIEYFLDIISPNNDMLEKMQTLFSNYPEIDLAALGFPNGWESEPLWTQQA